MTNTKAAREAKKLETELTRLFGETTYRVEKKACRGKYRGHNETCSFLAVYAVIVLSTNCGIRFVYRETMMHYALTGPGIGKYSFDACVENMLKDIHGGMRCTQPIIEEIAS